VRPGSLAARLALLFALLSFAVLATVGAALYSVLRQQLTLRDDAALVSRVDQIRTLLRDVDLLDLIHQKPLLFSNMLGNREALLVLRFAGEKPLIEVNPGGTRLPEVAAVGADTALSLADVHHTREGDIPFIAVAAAARTSDPHRELQIVAGRLMTERSRLLGIYRDRILLLASGGAALLAWLAWLVARRGLLPLRRLATQTASIGSDSLSTRIGLGAAPSELLPLIAAFNAMLDRLELSFTQLSQVSADMAHDLRTPIGNLLGQTEVALGQRRDAVYYEKLLASNFEELQRLSKMTDNMLFLARTEHAGHLVERRLLDIGDEFQRIGEYFEGPADERGIVLACRRDGVSHVWADPMLLRRALANLLANAVRHADAGSEIALIAERGADGCTVLAVENRGQTIPSHHLARLFDRFYRGDPARVGSSESSGLGLSIVRGIMMLHQGACGVSSADGVTRFSLRFAAAPAPAPA
jgi:two-component system heavy metal sensor histidine kinase CusS